MKRFIASALIFFATQTSFAQTAFAQSSDPNPVDFGPKQALQIVSESDTHSFNVEVADTPEKQRHGYMFKEALPGDEGMLFTFKNLEVQTIWMKNTPIPLDILFVRPNGKILKIEHSHQPYTLRSASSEAPVKGVIELIGGRARELGIEPGDLVKHSFFGTQ